MDLSFINQLLISTVSVLGEGKDRLPKYGEVFRKTVAGGKIGGLRESADPFASARKSIGKGTPEEKEELKKLDKELKSLESRAAAWNSSGDLTKQEMDKIRSKRKVRAALKKRDGLYKSLSGNWSVGSTIKKRKAEIEAYKIYLDELLSASRHKGKYGYI